MTMVARWEKQRNSTLSGCKSSIIVHYTSAAASQSSSPKSNLGEGLLPSRGRDNNSRLDIGTFPGTSPWTSLERPESTGWYTWYLARPFYSSLLRYFAIWAAQPCLRGTSFAVYMNGQDLGEYKSTDCPYNNRRPVGARTRDQAFASLCQRGPPKVPRCFQGQY